MLIVAIIIISLLFFALFMQDVTVRGYQPKNVGDPGKPPMGGSSVVRYKGIGIRTEAPKHRPDSPPPQPKITKCPQCKVIHLSGIGFLQGKCDGCERLDRTCGKLVEGTALYFVPNVGKGHEECLKKGVETS